MKTSEHASATKENSTNVRCVAEDGHRGAPSDEVEARAVRLFGTPIRRPDAAPPEAGSSSAEARTVRAGAETISTWSWGEGPTVLLVHGMSGWAGQMSRFVEPLVHAGFRVVAYDQPAHGLSTGETVTIVDLASTVLAIERALGPVRGVIAHSLGATGVALAAKDAHDPAPRLDTSAILTLHVGAQRPFADVPIPARGAPLHCS